MKIFKTRGIIYCESFLQLLTYYLGDDDRIGCSIEMFNNCREQGYIIHLHWEDEKRFDENAGLTIYVYNNRWSDEPTFTWEDKETFDTLYSEDAWENRTITCKHIEDLVKEAVDIIRKKFKEGEDK